jgi:hypothetical protein
MLKRVTPQFKQIKPPFKVNGGCVPYAVATICNSEEIIHQFPTKDQDGNAVSHDFYHASMMISQAWNGFMYFNVLLATSRTYDKRARLTCPKDTIQFKQFAHSAIIYAISKKHNKDVCNCVLLFDVHVKKSTHCIGVVLDLHTGKAIVIDRNKPILIKMKVADIFSHYRVLRVAVLKYSDRVVPLFPDSHFPHLIEQVDGDRSDT